MNLFKISRLAAVAAACLASATAGEIVIRWEGTVLEGSNNNGFFGSSLTNLAGARFVATFVVDTNAGDFEAAGTERYEPGSFTFAGGTVNAPGRTDSPIKSSTLTINGFTANFSSRNVGYYSRLSTVPSGRGSLIFTQASNQVATSLTAGLFPELFSTNVQNADLLYLVEGPSLADPSDPEIPYGGTMENLTRKVSRLGRGYFQRFNNSGEVLFGGRLAPQTVTISATPEPSAFRPVAPCRILDTRTNNKPIGVLGRFEFQFPSIIPRNVSLRGLCGLPADATAYSLNVTVVPQGPLGYVTAYPHGSPQPVASTLNSLDGRIKANAVVIPAGPDGSIDLFATDPTHIIIDVTGAFVPERTNPQAPLFYTVAPCRIVSTAAPGGGGTLQPNTNRSIIVANASGCGIPANASAYALNVTVVPKTRLGYLTLWPDNGSARPTASTLNALTGTPTANFAIVPAGSAGAINAFATEATELIIDVTGYFAPPGGLNALSFYPLLPCRTLDTRLSNAQLGGPILSALGTRTLPIRDSGCAVPQTSKAYSLNATVVPPAQLGFLTLFPTGVNLPVVSTLNAVDGSITSNAAIIPSDASPRGEISAYATERTHLLLDVNGYFAPSIR